LVFCCLFCSIITVADCQLRPGFDILGLRFIDKRRVLGTQKVAYVCKNWNVLQFTFEQFEQEAGKSKCAIECT